MITRRPKSILWFERFFIASFLLSAVQAALNWIENLSGEESSLTGWTTLVIGQMLATIIAFSIDIGLWFFIARRASNVAKWLLVAKTSLAFVAIIWVLPSLIQNSIVTIIASTLFTQALVLLSVGFLFRQEARSWFHVAGGAQLDHAELAERFR
ncbi:hypothetical protein [Sphingorhabdus sp. Alg231-15]|uniref:hypothetical protein n=1 Tax=Sphingorhabdus sp. Alg231-15 TaxID=1922222 RepID=UPI000D55C3C5